MKRQIIEIEEEKCNGCGLCIPNCHEGALQLIDGKARLISELFCDGLGACLGHCPEGAIIIVEREAEPYDEFRVMENLVPKGRNTILAHLEHLKEHGEEDLLAQAVAFLRENKVDLSPNAKPHDGALRQPKPQASLHRGGGCPGMAMHDFREKVQETVVKSKQSDNYSALRQWPVQLHLLNPSASYLQGRDMVLAADCVAFAMGNFHDYFLEGKCLAIAYPKLDHGQDVYVEKLIAIVRDARINTLTVVMMEVPCCSSMMHWVQVAIRQAGRKIPVKKAIVSIQGQLITEDWLLN
ncbi:MAG: ATP-binding protein [Bacteroidales bacterium]